MVRAMVCMCVSVTMVVPPMFAVVTDIMMKVNMLKSVFYMMLRRLSRTVSVWRSAPGLLVVGCAALGSRNHRQVPRELMLRGMADPPS